MTHDITEYDEDTQRVEESGSGSTPPLCLVHYFAERMGHPPERSPKLPGRSLGRVIARRGNLIILEFAPPPALEGMRKGRGVTARVYDALALLLLLACLLGCLAAFRF